MNRKQSQGKSSKLYTVLPKGEKKKVSNRVKDVSWSVFQHWEAPKRGIKPKQLWEEFEDVPQGTSERGSEGAHLLHALQAQRAGETFLGCGTHQLNLDI